MTETNHPMGPTPLYDALTAFAGQRPLRMHMPGHKGRLPFVPLLDGAAALDFTELTPTGDLFAGDGPIRAAEALWADVFHMPHCLFLTGGSTQGVHAALALACRPGGEVLVDRGCHRSVYHALALLDLRPVYLPRPWRAEAGIMGAIDPETVESLLTAHPEIKTVCITSPTYYGVLSDIPALAAATHRHGGHLVVDGAHGAHLPFLGLDHLSRADLAVVSAHKTLPALGQTALLLGGEAFSHKDLRRAASIYGTSSPSYVLMASLDLCRGWMEGPGREAYRRTAELVRQMRARLPALTEQQDPLDPARLVIHVPDGFAAQAALEKQGIFIEMADRGHLVCIPTALDTPEDLHRLERALAALPQGQCPQLPPPPLPETVLSPRQALFGPREAVPLERCVGRVCAQQIAPYPPGIPVAAPGERLDKKTVAYLTGIGYNREESVETVPPVCVEVRSQRVL